MTIYDNSLAAILPLRFAHCSFSMQYFFTRVRPRSWVDPRSPVHTGVAFCTFVS